MKNFTTFECLLELLTKELVEEGVKRYNADYYSKRFKTWDHVRVMVYAQLTQTKSLREIEIGFNSQRTLGRPMKLQKVARSTLSDANERRPSKCFLWIAEQLMATLPRKLRREIGKVVRLLDSSPIQLKGWGYDEWSKSHRTLRCQGLKLHIEYDAQMEAPVRVKTSYPNYNDCTMGQSWPLSLDTIYVFDKGYYDFNWWWKIHQKGAYFVTRLKENAAIKVLEQRPVEEEGILEDTVVQFKNKNPRGGKRNDYTETVRRVVVQREGNKKPLVLVTNIFYLSAKAIADLYKSRWDIELFFKWIKQHLKVKKFLGKSENAVKVQLATALIAYLLVSLFKSLFKNKLSLHHVLVWIRHNLHVRKKHYSTKEPPVYSIPKVMSLADIRSVYV